MDGVGRVAVVTEAAVGIQAVAQALLRIPELIFHISFHTRRSYWVARLNDKLLHQRIRQ